MECFNINQNMKYIIYGAGGNCRHVIDLLHSAQYPVAAVVDKRAESIKNIGEIPVCFLEETAYQDKDKKSSVVIISVKNVFEHINIARDLLEQGYENIIYKPFPILQGEHDEEWDSINEAYEMLLEEEKIPNGSRVSISRNNHMMVYKDELLIEESDSNVMCWLPAELICNYNREDAYGLIPMASYYPLLNMFQYLLGIGNGPAWEEIKNDFFLYSMDWVERTEQDFTESLKKSMLNSRINVCGNMQKKADIDKEFFIRNAVSVKYLDSARFYLSTSGRNRVAFMLAKGYRFVPVHMSKEDYDNWKNIPGFQILKEYLEKKKRNSLFAPIPHPMMVSYAVEAVDYTRLFCMPVIKEIYRMIHWKAAERAGENFKINFARCREEKKRIKIVTAMQDEGCISRLFSMCEINCYRWILSEEQKEISEQIDRLLRVDGNRYLHPVNSKEEAGKCQILVIDSRMDTSLMEEFQGDMVFMLQWGEEVEVDTKGRYNEKRILFQTIWNGQMAAGWMLQRGKKE